MDSKDRRKYPRLEGQFNVDVLNMGDDPAISPFEAIVPGEALDISRQGLRLKASYNAPLGSFLSVLVYFNGRESICLCQVVWKRDFAGQFLYGLYIKEWTQMDPALDRKLSMMEVEEMKPASPSPTVSAVSSALA